MFSRRDIERLYLRFVYKVKNILLSNASKEFFIFLFFFIVASAFWLLQTLDQQFETEISVPIRLKNVPDNIVITSDIPTGLKIKVRDKGTTLLNYKLTRTFFPININFNEFPGRNNVVRINSTVFQRIISGQLGSSTQILAVKPDSIEYYYSTGVSKMVPVRFNGKIKAGKQHFISDTIFTPDSVRVFAPENILDTLSAATLQYLTVDAIDDTVRVEAPLQQLRGVKYIPSAVNVTLPTDIYTEKTVEVPLEGINFPAGQTLRAFPSKVKVTFQVGLSKYRQINAEDFHILVSYEELLKLGSKKYTVRLRNVPAGVLQIRFNPEQVDFLIEKVDTAYETD